MERYYENYFEDDWPIPSQFDVAAFSSGLKAKCRESYERRTGIEYEEGSYNECDFGNLYTAQPAKRANEAAGTANTAFIGSSPPTNQFSPSKLTIKPSGPSSGPFLPGGGMTSLLSPSIHILALLLATAIALYNHRELARYILYWLARAAGIDLAAWPSTIHLLPTALRDITPNLPHATTTTTPTITTTTTSHHPHHQSHPHHHPPPPLLLLDHSPTRSASKKGLTAPALTALQACYLLTLLLLICICPTGVAEVVISSTWSGLVWPGDAEGPGCPLG
ncbi:hypothetical protein CHGG_04343 [Chaetomium globosum CBS 148.51]|uniref:Uncharacterized protein n=1 Tax=Chaetomium globosum (strain ATCC 6205 / CBS 148.51 / DSM 1962 / NBRC 6347 / NRRL 1970) TaxID=306901 RepID=Q2H1K3_CHAGB|nr:uncharacterized protein CHGG_04343 [Chaetomium globosum CBS 148.51]EAQ87724.1 hypothetical protein CHGG_04343 [Chaetomium globosum CBS 148.51]